MRLRRVRFTIGRLMIVVAVAGVLSAWLRGQDAGALMVAALLILTLPSIGLLYPFLFAKPGRRLLAATWVAALWPLTIPWSLHAAWVVGYGYLGHAPGPADNGLVIEVLTGSVAIFMILSLFATIVCLCLAYSVTDERIANGNVWISGGTPVVSMILAWGSVVGICGLDPINAVWWLID